MKNILSIKHFVFIALITSMFASCVSKSKHDNLVTENKKLSDSLQILVDEYINGKKVFLHSDSLFKKRKFLDAKIAFTEYKLKYPKSKFLSKTDSIILVINKKAIESFYNTSLSYQYFYQAYLSIKNHDNYSTIESYFSNGTAEYKKLQFSSDEKELKEFKEFMNSYFKTVEEFDVDNYNSYDMDTRIRFITYNGMCGERLKRYGNKLKIIELKNE
jgi:hypothetical protein